MSTDTTGSASAQLEGDAIPGLAPPKRSGMSIKAVVALGVLVVSVIAVSVVVGKRFLDGKKAAEPAKTPEVASATAQRLRTTEPRPSTLPVPAPPAQSGAASGAQTGDGQAAGKPKVPALAETDAKPIEVVRAGQGKPGAPAGAATGAAQAAAPTIHPMDAPVFSSQARAQPAARPQATRQGMGAGAGTTAGSDAPVDEEARDSSLARTMAELQGHKARLQAELDRRLGKPAGDEKAADRPAERAQAAISAMASRFGPPILPDASASQPGRLLGGSMDQSATPRVSAHRPFNRALTVPKGTIFQCALQTRVVTATSGFVNCLVQRDVYGHDGKVVLVERGSNLVGEYRMTAVRPGLTRIPVVWTRVLTPHAVSVDLESPAVGQLGESGIGGHVDNRWPERIGAALLVSLVDDALQLATQRQDASGNTVYLPSTTSQGSKLAEEVLKSTINIPPLLYQNQGGVVGVFVARDLDFSNVYRLVAE